MNRIISVAICVASLLLPAPAFPCSVFCVSDGNHAYGGNNEDGSDLGCRMWVVPAEGPGKHGRVYFGLSDGFPQGGINDAGLFFDGLALDTESVPSSPDRPAFSGNLSDRALAECTSVEEVISLFERYDRRFLAQAQLLFGDRKGDGVSIEGNAVIRKKGRSLLATNFRQSKTPPAAATCPRFKIGSRMLGGETVASVDLCRRVLAAVHTEGQSWTLYSNIYDLNAGKIYLYHFHDFGTAVVIDVAQELAKGPHSCEVASLFPESFIFSLLRQRVEQEVAARKERLIDQTVDPASFAAYVGRYRVEGDVGAGLELRVRLDGTKLYLELPVQGRFELTPRGNASFVAITPSGDAEIVFRKGNDGGVARAVGKYQGLAIPMVKVKEDRPEGGK